MSLLTSSYSLFIKKSVHLKNQVYFHTTELLIFNLKKRYQLMTGIIALLV